MLHLTTSSTSEIWDALAEDLRRFIGRRISDPTVAEDLLHDVFLRVHRHRVELREEDRVAGWVFRIARNAVTDHLRQRGRVVSLDEEPLDAAADDDDDDDARAAALVLGRWLTTMIETLEPPYREALTLTDLQGLSQREAARRLGLSYSGMKSRVQRGRAKLRAVLNRCCEVELDATGSVIAFAPRTNGCATPSDDCC